MRIRRSIGWVLGSASLLVGCTADSGGFGADPPDADPEVSHQYCVDPVLGPERFTEQALARGITPDTTPPADRPLGGLWAPGRVVAEDLDEDGDLDLLFSHGIGRPQLYLNDGTGRFHDESLDSLGPLPGNAARQAWSTFSVVDLVGDFLPDLVIQGAQELFVAENKGDGQFGPLATFGSVPGPETVIYMHAWGDPDGDADLDLFVPTMATLDVGLTPEPLPEQLLLNNAGLFATGGEYHRHGESGLSIVAAWTDRDNDGDLDLLSYSDRADVIGSAGTAYRNEGGVDADLLLVEDGAEIGMGLPISAMGYDSADINGDGVLDYCTTDIGNIDCLTSVGDVWVETALARGITSPPRELSPWVTWGLELVDLDHDGWLDMPVTGAATAPELIDIGFEDEWVHADELYWGSEDGFERVGAQAGFDSTAPHPGLVAADLDGNGFQDLVVTAWDAPVQVFMNACNDNTWLSVKPRGAPGNELGFGARVTIDDGDFESIREIQGQRVFGQGPARAHFGLAETDVVDVPVRWPDGAEVELTGVQTRQEIVVQHPG